MPNLIERLEARTFLSLAQPDSSFSGDGAQSYPFAGEQSIYYDSSFDVARDGKIVVAATTRGRDSKSQILLERLNPTGELDQTFGTGGQVRTALSGPLNFDNAVAVARKVLVQKDGKILVAGSLGENWAVFRFNSDGSLDSSFDGDGIQSFEGHLGSVAVDIALLPSGEIVVGGDARSGEYTSTHVTDFGLMRLKSSGAVDGSFGNEGYVVNDLGLGDQLNRIALDERGNILVGGSSSLADGSYQPQVVLMRYRANGALDPSFGKRGKVITKLKSGAAAVSSFAALANGRILVSGSNNDDGFLIRLNRRGTIDRTFASRGMATLDTGSSNDHAIILRANRRQIAVLAVSPGDYSYPAKDSRQYLMTYRSDGSNGTLSKDFKLGMESAHQLNGGARLVGNSVLGLFTRMANSDAANLTMARFSGSGEIDPRFGRAGRVTMSVKGPLDGSANNIVTQVDGKSVVLASVATSGWNGYYLLRLKPTGELDSSFGDGGKVVLDSGGSSIYYSALGLDQSGSILVGATDWSAAGPIVRRFKPDGSADNSFGDHGRTVAGEGMASTSQIISLPGGKLLVAGSEDGGIGIAPLGITRLNGDGSVDRSFGQNGTLTDSFLGANSIDKVLVGADGRLTVVGTASEYRDLAPPDPVEVFIGRYNADGSVDKSFARVLMEDTQYTYDSRLTSDGGVVILAYGSNEREFKVIQYKKDGKAGATKVRQAPDDIVRAFFEADGRILLLTKSSTLRLAADGSTIAGSHPGPAIHYVDFYGGVISITPAHKLLVGQANADGDLTLRRYLLE